MWRYTDESAAYIFRGVEVDPVAQGIREALASGPKSQAEIGAHFGRHIPAKRLNEVLREMRRCGQLTLTTVQTSGRSRSIWTLARR